MWMAIFEVFEFPTLSDCSLELLQGSLYAKCNVNGTPWNYALFGTCLDFKIVFLKGLLLSR